MVDELQSQFALCLLGLRYGRGWLNVKNQVIFYIVILGNALQNPHTTKYKVVGELVYFAIVTF